MGRHLVLDEYAIARTGQTKQTVKGFFRRTVVTLHEVIYEVWDTNTGRTHDTTIRWVPEADWMHRLPLRRYDGCGVVRDYAPEDRPRSPVEMAQEIARLQTALRGIAEHARICRTLSQGHSPALTVQFAEIETKAREAVDDRAAILEASPTTCQTCRVGGTCRSAAAGEACGEATRAVMLEVPGAYRTA